MDSRPKATPLGYSCRLRLGGGLFYWNGGDAAECKDRSRRWTVYNPLFMNSYVDVGMF
jgi:hypothetical protein